MRNRQRKSRDSGQSIIETLLTLPFLLTVLLNAVNFGYFYFVARPSRMRKRARSVRLCRSATWPSRI